MAPRLAIVPEAELDLAAEMHAPIHETYRRALIRRFPFAIFYEYAGVEVTIYAVFQTSRDPEKWRQRLP
jgi:hypothetical protein